MSNLESSIDLLEELIENSKSIPFTNSIRIDRDELYDILVELRASMPEEIRDAKKVINDCEEFINEAKKEADAIIKQAEFDASKLVSEHEVYLKAVDSAEEVKQAAQLAADNGVMEAALYIDKLLEESGETASKIYSIMEEQQRVINENFGRTGDIILQMREELRQ